MAILAIDTAAPVIGAAVLHAGQLVQRTARTARAAERELVPWIGALCAEAGVTVQDLTGVAVAVGPGSFTGLRVGIATGVGVAQALGIPVWPGPSLEHRATAVAEPRVLALLDARKGRFYAAAYKDGTLREGPADVPIEVALGWMRPPFFATGEGAILAGAAVLLAGGIIAAEAEEPAVAELARLAAQAFARGEGHPAIDIVPVYVREPDALPHKG
jgi:tRNA threonylcarbamoyladenosine biosynthesis protein TsaB